MRSDHVKKHAQLRKSAKKRGIEFLLSKAEVRVLMDGAGVCPLCALPFLDDEEDRKRSFDRIDPRYGYVVENIKVICVTCNVVKERLFEHVPAGASRDRRLIYDEDD